MAGHATALEGTDGSFLVPPVALPFKRLQATFGLPAEKFLAALQLILPAVHSQAGPWQLDGCRTGTIYLRKAHGSSLLPLLPQYIYQELEFTDHGNGVTLGIWTRLPGEIALFEDIVQALTRILPRTA